MDNREALINLAYVLAAALFIFGLKGLTHPRTAVRGNMLGALGMLIAILATLAHQGIVAWYTVAAAMALGAIVGAVLALRIRMTAMPQMVALLNGFGGIASALVAWAVLITAAGGESLQSLIAADLSGIIGGVTFTGSLVAFAKLQGLINEQPILLPHRHLVSLGVLLLAVLFAVLLVLSDVPAWVYLPLLATALALGVLLVIGIGGADMPVVIALLNSYSGLAAAATGFVINNSVLIIAGSLVGASGVILTRIMCRAMNRSLSNVLFGGFGAAVVGEKQADIYEGRVKATSAEEVAMLLDGARRVVFVPGYGMAVAGAQHAVHDLGKLLADRGVRVDYAIHPVAGRMPGHMNVLLAEANVPYEQLKEMSEINADFAQTDVSIVIGANDVVNPVARTDPNSPIAGMPILDVDKSKTVVVIKRSLSPGFAGIANPLFAAENTLMYFADARRAMLDVLAAMKET